MNYHFIQTQLDDFRFLNSMKSLFTRQEVDFFLEEDLDQISRIQCEGLFTIIGWIDQRRVGLIYSDFRVNGAGYAERNSSRFSNFLNYLQRERIPGIFVGNTIGLSLMGGRKVFRNSFGIWPHILNFSRTNLLITIAVGKCLGLGPVLFAHGHYRMAIKNETRLNLTGPEVLKNFFGKNFQFDEFASAERQLRTTDLIHEMVESTEEAFDRARCLLRMRDSDFLLKDKPCVPTGNPRKDVPIQNIYKLLDEIGEERVELFSGMDPLVKIFVVKRGTRPIGVFINPPGNQVGMVTVDTLQKYAAGLDLFKALGIPVMSLLDAPGIDPRFDQSDRNIIRVMIWLGEKIIHFPHGHMGIAVGRVYGGATTLVFHRNFGGRKSLALKGAKMGSMHESLISKVLDGTPRLLEEWKQVAAKQTPDFKDLIDSGNLDKVIEMNEIGAEVDDFLALLESEKEGRNRTLDLPSKQGSQSSVHEITQALA